MNELPKEFGFDNGMPVESQKFGMLFEGCEKKCPTLTTALKKIEELEKWYKALLVDYKRVKQERSDLIQPRRSSRMENKELIEECLLTPEEVQVAIGNRRYSVANATVIQETLLKKAIPIIGAEWRAMIEGKKVEAEKLAPYAADYQERNHNYYRGYIDLCNELLLPKETGRLK